MGGNGKPRRRRPCVHCGRKLLALKKGLCHGCWTRYRSRYDSKNYVGLWTEDGFRPLPVAYPTGTYAGTPERVRVLVARAEAGLTLWHADDARRRLVGTPGEAGRPEARPCGPPTRGSYSSWSAFEPHVYRQLH